MGHGIDQRIDGFFRGQARGGDDERNLRADAEFLTDFVGRLNRGGIEIGDAVGDDENSAGVSVVALGHAAFDGAGDGDKSVGVAGDSAVRHARQNGLDACAVDTVGVMKCWVETQ